MENYSAKTSYEELLKNKDFFIIAPTGTSMLPMLDEKCDTIKIIKAPDKLKKYDVILYKRIDGTYVLHRIIKIKKDYYLLSGDHQVIKEKVYHKQIIGLLDGYYHYEVYIANNDPNYLKYVKKRMRSRKYRYLRYLLSNIYHKIFKKKKTT